MTGFDTSYTGPNAELRNDRSFQLARACSDLDFAQCCARDADTALAARGRAAIPGIIARIDALAVGRRP